MSAARVACVLWFTLAAGCAGIPEMPPGVAAQAEPPIVARSETVSNADEPVAAAQAPTETIEEARADVVAAEPHLAVKAAPPSGKSPVKIPAAPVTLALPGKIELPVSAARNVAPALDVASLKARLRDTDAIGVLTKLSLKNQVDDLLNGFRAHYRNGQKTSVASLRQPYDMLVLKVLSLIQDADPSLARTISGSREAIWNILADPDQFKLVN